MREPIEPAAPNGQKKHPLIYLVDDEPTLVDLAEMSLAGGCYAFKKFLDPEEALKAFRTANSNPFILPIA